MITTILVTLINKFDDNNKNNSNSNSENNNTVITVIVDKNKKKQQETTITSMTTTAITNTCICRYMYIMDSCNECMLKEKHVLALPHDTYINWI